MKVEILRENLKNGIGMAERVVGKNLSLPILDGVLMEAEDSFLSLTSTDLETAVRLWILTKIVKKGRAVVPAKLLSQFIASLPNDKITMEWKNQGLYVECKNLKTQIQGHSAEDFPIIPELKNPELLDIDAKKIWQALSQTVDVAAPSQSRPEISGIYFNFSKQGLRVAATDSFRLAEKTINLDKPVKKEHSFILPQKPAREIMAVLEGKEGRVAIHIAGNQVLFELPMKEAPHPQVQVTSRLIEGEYPNYQDIIPTAFKCHVVVGRDELLNQIKTASIFSSKTNEVKISVNQETKSLDILARNQDLGESASSVPAVIEGEPMAISFNYKFLVDGIANIKSSEVVFDISKEEGPCVLRPVGDASYLYVVMPIKSM